MRMTLLRLGVGVFALAGCAVDEGAGAVVMGTSQAPTAMSPSTVGSAGVVAAGGSASVSTGRSGSPVVAGRMALPIGAGSGGSGLASAGSVATTTAGAGGISGQGAVPAAGSGGAAVMEMRGLGADCQVGPIPDDVRSEYELDPFYKRYASAAGTPIVATDKPEDESIRRACHVVLDLSATLAGSREQMHKGHVYFIMMAKTEKTVETPEYRSRGDLDRRARGFGNNPGLCAEENVMCDTMTDRWRGESICVHEYAHVMHLYVWNEVDPMFDSKVNAAFQNATRTMGKYRNTYADDNSMEYFAEGVQNWYNTNLESRQGEAGDGVHNHINTRAEFKEYDAMLYDLLTKVLPDVPTYKDCYYYGD